MDGGLAPVRFDRDDSPLQLGRARLALSQPLGELWSVRLDGSVYDDKGGALAGITEGYLQFRPYPREGFRLRVKAGAFYPPVSLENRAAAGIRRTRFPTLPSTAGWPSRCARSGSRPTSTGSARAWDVRFDLGVTAAAFGLNEQAGAVLAGTGFSLTDRQTPLFGRVGQPGVAPLYGVKPFVRDRRPCRAPMRASRRATSTG